ncbi:hypothetical protein AURDEDRAFT_178481 [Auricularia subglabra TFB-10046 SS5]|uniref:Uncharacterized protein n=1 Tax=Auricularia subglabra (strain TFB-10046 / SS5) TaxID=717982 RepID=J0CQI4_AURST|nr:hypothetical protein AURDEDRAFT_178481 [Auricularia subglabra TFB-10046 SS5]
MRPLSEHAARRTRRVPIASVISVNLESAVLEHTSIVRRHAGVDTDDIAADSTSLEALPIARPPTPRLASPSTPASMARGSPDCPDGRHHTPAPGTSSICPADARSR